MSRSPPHNASAYLSSCDAVHQICGICSVADMDMVLFCFTLLWLRHQFYWIHVTQFPISLSVTLLVLVQDSLIVRFMGPTWGPAGAYRTQVGPMLDSWTLLSGLFTPVKNHARYMWKTYEGLRLLTWMNFNPSMDKYSHPGKYGIKLYIHSQTPAAAPLKFANGEVISFHML